MVIINNFLCALWIFVYLIEFRHKAKHWDQNVNQRYSEVIRNLAESLIKNEEIVGHEKKRSDQRDSKIL